MKTSQLLFVALLGLVVYLVLKSQGGLFAAPPATSNPTGGAPAASEGGGDVFTAILSTVTSAFNAVKQIASSTPKTT